MSTNQTNRRVEVVMAFSTDATKATQGLDSIATSAKNVDLAAKNAQKALQGVNGASGMPTPYGVQGSTYGVQQPNANRIGYSNGMTPPQPPAFPTTAIGPDGRRYSYSAYSGAQKSVAADVAAKEQADAVAAINGTSKGSAIKYGELAIKAAIGVAAIQSLTKGIETLGDVTKGSRAKVLGLTETFPLVGETAAGLSRALINLGDFKLRKGIMYSGIGAAEADTIANARFTGEQTARQARRESESTIAGNRGFFGGGVVVPVDGEDERVTQAKMDVERAKKAAEAAAKDKEAFEKERKQADLAAQVNQRSVDVAAAAEREAKKSKEAQEKSASFYRRNDTYIDLATSPLVPLMKAGAGFYSNRSPLNGIEQGIETNRERKDLGRALVDQTQAVRTENEKNLELIKKQAELEKTKTDLMRAQAAVLKDQLATAKAQDRATGAMSLEDKQRLLAVAREAKDKGFGNLSEEKRNLLLGNSLTSNFFGKEAEKIGANDPWARLIRQITGDKSASQLEGELKNIAAKIDVKIEIDEADLAQKLANVLGDFIKKLELIIRNQTNNTADQIRTDAEKAQKMQEASL